MSLFRKPSQAMTDAIQKSQSIVEAGSPPLPVHVHGYGVVSMERAHKEAQASSDEASRHTSAQNHGSAAYHHKRAAMFHDAIAQHHEMTSNKRAANEAAPAVAEAQEEKKEKPEPFMGRVSSKFKRNQRREYAKKDKKDND